MNKKISLVLAGIGIAGVALTGCKSSGHAAASSSSLHAVATSSAVKSEAAQAGKAALSTCVPAKNITKAYLASLALDKNQRDALAVKCDIPADKRKPFVKAVAASALNAYLHGDFKTVKGREEWANKVFPVILKAFQAKS